MTVLNYYLESRTVKDFNKVLELLVCDRVTAVLDDACLKHILMLKNSTTDGWLGLTNLTTAIDKYYANCACTGSQRKTTVASQMSVPVRSGSQTFTPRSGYSSSRSLGGFGVKPQTSPVHRCFECNSPDHIRAQCPHVRANNSSNNGTQSGVNQIYSLRKTHRL